MVAVNRFYIVVNDLPTGFPVHGEAAPPKKHLKHGQGPVGQ